MFHVYTEKSNTDFSRTHIGDYSDFEEAMDAAENPLRTSRNFTTLWKKQTVLLIVTASF